MSELLNEVFDADKELDYPVINLNPKYKIPQVWQFVVPGQDALMARLMQFTGKETVKQYKQGDKIAEVFLLSGTSHGHASPLKGGLGDKPLDAIQLIFRTVWSSIKVSKPDVVLFRFPSKKMKGQERALMRVLDRLIRSHTGGRYLSLQEAQGLGKKNGYVIMYRKGVDLNDFDIAPTPAKFKKEETKVGDVYLDTDTGKTVSKDQVAAEAFVDAAEKKTDQAVAKQTKISRRALISAQAMGNEIVPPGWEEVDARSAELSKPSTAELIDNSAALLEAIKPTENKANESADIAVRALRIGTLSGMPTAKMPELESVIRLKDQMAKALKRAPINSIRQMEIFVDFGAQILDELSIRKAEAIRKDEEAFNTPKSQVDAKVKRMLRYWKTKGLRSAAKDFSSETSTVTYNYLMDNSDTKRFTSGQRAAINSYCGPAYSDVNDYLLGRYDVNEPDLFELDEVKSIINSMDKAFETGHRLPEGIELWRAQKMRFKIYNALRENRLFYFRNYVSTSLMPIIFGNWQSNMTIGVATPEVHDELAFDKNYELPRADASDTVDIGWHIVGANKINVVVPGKLSPSPSEQEVILPRGTTLKILKITDASSNDGMEHSNNKLINAEIMTSDQLSESIVYDGDALMETGELVPMNGFAVEVDEPMSFDTFVKSTKLNPRAIIADIMDVDAMPKRFVQG